ncbi:MAG: NAD-dependent epimerase/dehydratase family protein [Prolixibacteraceae bacterium]|jgi:GDP-4-dehydro-6-deoxy-D-mannose reductase|nr:NAD-dependent epimerase/dehydratase family protein [Prolixibacteraceae bacterium]
MKSVLITGALGFCAGHLVRRLRTDYDVRIFGIDIADEALPELHLDAYLSVDICDRERLEYAIKFWEPDTIFHLAGVIGDDLYQVYRINFSGSINLFEAVRRCIPNASVLIIGSSAEYGFAAPGDFPLTEEQPCRPFNAYGISKHAVVLAGQNYVQKEGLKIVAARPFNIIGPGIPPTLVVGAIIKRIKDSLNRKDKKLVIKMGNLNTERDFINVNDAMDAYIKIAQGDFWGEVFNICSGKPYSIRKVVEVIAGFSGMPVEIEHDPALVRIPDIDISFGSYAKAHRAFGFEPVVDIERSLFETWRQYMERA